MLCTGSGCDRAAKCGLYYANPQSEDRKYWNVESLASCGSGSISLEEFHVDYWCGPCGNYKMFEPISEELKFKILENAFNSLGYNIPQTTLQDILKQLEVDHE